MIGFYAAGAMGQGGGGGGGFPIYAHGETSAYDTQTQPQIVTLPATINNGDRVIIQYATGDVTVTTPAGWTLIGSNNNTGVSLSLYYRDCDGTEGGTTVSFAMSGGRRATVIVHRIQAGTFASGTAPSATFSTGASGTNPDPPSHSPAWGAADTLWIACYGQRNDQNSVSATFPFPDGNLHAKPSGTGTAHNNTASCWSKQNVASVDPGNFTNGVVSNSTWVAATMAVRPA